MSILTAEKVTNLYLYGSETKPTSIIDQSLIRPQNDPVLEISVNGNDFMQTGPGRFAYPVLWDVVTKFFNLNVGLQAGTYTEKSLRNIFGISINDATKILQQYNYDDGKDNYAERVYIWNSGKYEIDDSALFVVKPNGNRVIEHLAVIPLGPKGLEGAHGGILDNFDLVGGNAFTNVGNYYLESRIDPSDIGHKVNIEITDVTNFRTYTIANFVTDIQKYNTSYDNTVSIAPKLATEGSALVEQLFNTGSIKFLHGNIPVLYGTNSDDSLSWAKLVDAPLLNPYKSNGVVLVAGAGNDVLTGASYADTLLGGAGNDTLIGGLNKDTLTGGTGTDKFDFNVLRESGAAVAQMDVITDFNHAQIDKIDLHDLDANAALSGNQNFIFIGSATFSSAGQVRFDSAKHILYVSNDADTTAEFAVQLNGVTSLQSSDFIL